MSVEWGRFPAAGAGRRWKLWPDVIVNDRPFWKRAWGGIWAAAAVLSAVCAMGMPTGLGAALDVFLMVFVGTAVLGLSSILLALLLSWARVPLPRLFAGGYLALCAGACMVFRLSGADWSASLLLSGCFAAAGATMGMLSSVLSFTPGWFRLQEQPRLAFTAGAGAALLLLLLPLGLGLRQHLEPQSAAAVGDSTSASASKGSWSKLTYGSGSDKRAEFGKDAALLSEPVDASELLPSWSRRKTLYWGFTPSRLPLNGTVWLPEGSGAAPLILMVHGNHLAEQDSDQGYAYLGQMLASAGYAAVSVDENFLNYSIWSGIPQGDMKLRAWLLLRHLDQLTQWSTQPASPLYGRLDMEQVALLGHSRGGQAVAMAADAARWFSTEPVPAYRIQAVAALAPTDMSVDGERPRLTDISYLALHGSRDADLTDFFGERQYNRTDFTLGSSAFKAAVYIDNANHSRFNSDWGTMDNSLPGGLLLSQRNLLSGEDQREIASVYVHSFLDSVFKGDAAARDMMRCPDPQRDGLPDTRYTVQYADAGFHPLEDFEGFKSAVTTKSQIETSPGVTESLEAIPSRTGQGQGSSAAILSWTGGRDNYYRLLLAGFPSIPAEGGIAFSAASRSRELCTEGAACAPEDIELTIALRDADGHLSQTAVDSSPLKAPQQDGFLRLPWLQTRISGGKYAYPAAEVLQTYWIPLRQLFGLNPRLNPSRLVSLEIRFAGERGGSGKLMLDNIGWYDS